MRRGFEFRLERDMTNSRFVQITRKGKIPEDEFRSMIKAMNRQIRQDLFPPPPFMDILTGTAAYNVITAPDAPIPDCMTCGACCTAFPAVAVCVSDTVSAEDYWDITKQGESGEIVVDRYLRRDGETLACSSLDGTLGKSVSCRIYENRPQICRRFEVGSDRCHEVRRAYGFEPDLTLFEMCEANRKLDVRLTPAASETIESAKISERTGTVDLETSVTLKDGGCETIHVFDPSRETWLQSEFDELTLSQAREIIASRKRSEEQQPG